ncbi:hypothetical protein MUK70_01035 [Dyadobacter chenwenxiniae]|uniref:Uncharacterized protein n=1 Tax=Dyadobacter chenwenxiniae TaxID=2906456 RepID=A0A9X1TLS0_9BACT|nr:hypothetical protein [Dyadobacter chenwenxiniae]MCF0062668.1 hypothetical protein [Dyadobacter chenwenxiniae]UON83588.1 hypothetical protein MUK70_01035 [Dyadobacter chenwenxiniae]
METKNKEDADKATAEAVENALASGRNANDNFQEEGTDDYGTEGSAEEKIKRNDIKGGSGQRVAIRNSNDNFRDDDQQK